MTTRYKTYVCPLQMLDRLVNMPIERLTRRIFEYDYISGIGNWCYGIKTLFHKRDLEYVYYNKQLVSKELPLSKIESLMAREWEWKV